ncbi:hypothetical protein F4604DRAFT_1674260 [Suillus subluteus]|nr:hypothetical protein F4604DRAFT_1674260 [Suillus subluteus]
MIAPLCCAALTHLLTAGSVSMLALENEVLGSIHHNGMHLEKINYVQFEMQSRQVEQTFPKESPMFRACERDALDETSKECDVLTYLFQSDNRMTSSTNHSLHETLAPPYRYPSTPQSHKENGQYKCTCPPGPELREKDREAVEGGIV